MPFVIALAIVYAVVCLFALALGRAASRRRPHLDPTD
jgi:hypothetical protein